MRATLEKNPKDVSAMFDKVASRYDLMNNIASLGILHYWRAATTRAVVTRPGLKVLDVCAGTGTSTNAYQNAGAKALATDFSPGMIAQGKRQYPQLNFTLADAMNLPMTDESFDCVTVSYGLRNIQNPSKALREFWRVTRPGGHLVICEFSHPTCRPINSAYKIFLHRVIPKLAQALSSEPESYTYLTESILAWPPQKELGILIGQAGWQRVQYKNLSGGIVALHRARKPLETNH